MFKVKIFSIGRTKELWLQEALSEYEKRLSRHMEIEWSFAKDEADLAKKAVPPWVALDIQGEALDSLSASKRLENLFLTHGSRLHFLIGGADGIPQKMVEQSVWNWSLSPLTFTHQMTRLILLEQLYRAVQIASGTSYHK